MISRVSPKIDGLKAASYEKGVRPQVNPVPQGLTDAVSISVVVGAFPLGPFFEMNANLRRQYLAITSTRPSEWAVRWVINDRRYVSKFLDGGKVTRKTQRSCHPLNTLSLDHRKISMFRYPRGRIVGNHSRARVSDELLHYLAIDLVPKFTVG